jgi:hypothetical protein
MDKTLTITLPSILPAKATAEVWVKDMTTVINTFKKSAVADDDPTKVLIVRDIKHVITESPFESIESIESAGVRKAFDDLATTVTEINALQTLENGVRQAADILGRDLLTLKDVSQLRLRFVLELSAPALRAAALRVRKDYPGKPENFDKMTKKEQKKFAPGNCDWNPYTDKRINDVVAAAQAGTLIDNYQLLQSLSCFLTSESAHAAWRIEAARRHPDQGGSIEASKTFGEVWDRVEKSFPAAQTAAA